jgi:hypothetical protein
MSRTPSASKSSTATHYLNSTPQSANPAVAAQAGLITLSNAWVSARTPWAPPNQTYLTKDGQTAGAHDYYNVASADVRNEGPGLGGWQDC